MTVDVRSLPAVHHAPDAPTTRSPLRLGLRPSVLLVVGVAAVLLCAVGARLPAPVGPRVAGAQLTFVALFVASLPFLLAGAVLSAVLRGRAGAPLLRAAIGRPRLAAALAPLVGLGLPICDCGLLPLARELRDAGGRRTVTTFLAGAPLTNPIVIVTTVLAFPQSPLLVVGRVGAGLIVAMFAGFLVPPVPLDGDIHDHSPAGVCTPAASRNRVLPALATELTQTAPALVVGALLAAVVKAFVPLSTFTAFATHPLLGAAALMSLAFIMSICSQADAFVAASLPVGPLPRLAFLVLGPVLDLRLAVLYRREFGLRWVMSYAGVIIPTTFAVVVVLATLGLA